MSPCTKRVMVYDSQPLCQAVEDLSSSVPHGHFLPPTPPDSYLPQHSTSNTHYQGPQPKKPKMTLLYNQEIYMPDTTFTLYETEFQPVAVLLRVTCLSGFWKGVVHYHHVLPTPQGADETWFDEKFLKTGNKKGIVRVGKTSLLCQAGCMDENISNLLWAGMQTLGELYDESMVMTGEWGSLQSDFDGRLVNGGTTLRELVTTFLATRPRPGEPLVLTPIMKRRPWHYVAE